MRYRIEGTIQTDVTAWIEAETKEEAQEIFETIYFPDFDGRHMEAYVDDAENIDEVKICAENSDIVTTKIEKAEEE